MLPYKRTRYYGYTQTLFAIVYFQAKCMGVINFKYDVKSNVVKRSTFSFWYGIGLFCVLCGLTVTLTCMSFPNHGQWDDIHGKNRILLLISSFNILIFTISVTYIFLNNIMFIDDYLKLANSLTFLNIKYFQLPSEAAQKKLFYYCLLKYLSTLSFNVMMMIPFFYSKNLMFILYRLTSVMIFNIMETSLSLIFMTILIITKFYRLLNIHLKTLLEDINRSHRMAGLSYLKNKIDELSCVYKEVHGIHKFSFKITQIQVWAILVTGYINNIVRAYQLYNYWWTENANPLNRFLMILSLTIHCFDLYIFIQACDENVEAWKNSRRILSGFTVGQGVDLQLERSVSMFLNFSIGERIE